MRSNIRGAWLYKFIFLRVASLHLPAMLHILAGLSFSRLSVALYAMAPSAPLVRSLHPFGSDWLGGIYSIESRVVSLLQNIFLPAAGKNILHLQS